MNPITFLTTPDTVLRSSMQAIAVEAEKQRGAAEENLATRIANAVGRMLGGK